MSDKAQQLMQEGFEALEDDDFETALKIAKKLTKLKHTSTFEIAALAYAGQGDVEKAIKTLEQGIEIAPGIWTFWQLLGNYRSDCGDYAGAQDAYASALACETVEGDSVRINLAIAQTRVGQYEEAWATLEQVGSEWARYVLRADVARVGVLRHLERGGEALELGSKRLDALDDDADPLCAAMLEAELARLHYDRGEPDTAREHALAALQWDPNHENAFWLIRELDDVTSQNSRRFWIMVDGRWPEPGENGEILGFFCSYSVIADTREEALDYIRRIHPLELADSMRIDDFKDDGPAGTDDYAGVYSSSGLALFDEDGD